MKLGRHDWPNELDNEHSCIYDDLMKVSILEMFSPFGTYRFLKMMQNQCIYLFEEEKPAQLMMKSILVFNYYKTT